MEPADIELGMARVEVTACSGEETAAAAKGVEVEISYFAPAATPGLDARRDGIGGSGKCAKGLASNVNIDNVNLGSLLSIAVWIPICDHSFISVRPIGPSRATTR